MPCGKVTVSFGKRDCAAYIALLEAPACHAGPRAGGSQMCGRGGTGRRAALRSLWPKGRGSSSLLDRTIDPEVGRSPTGTCGARLADRSVRHSLTVFGKRRARHSGQLFPVKDGHDRSGMTGSGPVASEKRRVDSRHSRPWPAGNSELQPETSGPFHDGGGDANEGAPTGG